MGVIFLFRQYNSLTFYFYQTMHQLFMSITTKYNKNIIFWIMWHWRPSQRSKSILKTTWPWTCRGSSACILYVLHMMSVRIFFMENPNFVVLNAIKALFMTQVYVNNNMLIKHDSLVALTPILEIQVYI